MKRFITLFSALYLTINGFGQTTSQTDTLPSGELVLMQEVLIDRPVNEVWEAFVEPEKWKEWVSPVVEIDFRINGTIKSHYDPNAAIGDSGTIVIHLLFYIPQQQIVMQSEIAENFPEFMKGEEENLYSMYYFDEVSDEQTRLTLYGIGYKNEKRWHDLLKFFVKGNEMTLNNLKKYLEKDGQRSTNDD